MNKGNSGACRRTLLSPGSTNKMRGEFYVPIPSYVADAIEVWESVRPPNQKPLLDRKTHKPTHYLFQYRNEPMGTTFLNDSAIPLLCKLAGVSQTDVVGRITSHRARATTATWMRKMGMAPADIGKLLGHTNPAGRFPGICVKINIIWAEPIVKRIRLSGMSPPSWIPMLTPGRSRACSTTWLMAQMAAPECAAIRTSRAVSIK